MEKTYNNSCKMCNVVYKYLMARYPNMICNNCLNNNTILDSMGNIVSFNNLGFSGGFESVHIINNISVTKNEHDCYINNIKCYADESRFGGIVIQIVPDNVYI